MTIDQYQQSRLEKTEIIEVIEDYNYGSVCKIQIPSISPLIPAKKYERVYLAPPIPKNILNKDPSKLGLSKYTSIGFVMMTIPLELCPKCKGIRDPIYDIPHSPSEVHHVW